MDARTLAKEAKLTQARLRELLRYDPETGLFSNLVRRGNALPEKVSGSIIKGDRYGYVRLSIDRVPFQAHRVAWFYMTGMWPKDEIDHRDRVRSNNRFRNLREAANSLQKQNTGVRKDSVSGLKGVCWRPNRKQWRARIGIDGKQVHLGWFATPEAASAAYLAAKAQLHTFQPTPRF